MNSAKDLSKGKNETDCNNLTAEEDAYIGPFAPHAANNAPVWAIYGAQAKISDQQIFKICNNDLDSLLIFAGLFSAILSAFLIEIRKGLQEDLQETTNALLLSLIELQRNASAVLTTPNAFIPSSSTQWINGLWFSSLIFSLTSALGASLAKGWIAQYDQASSGTTAEDACSRHRRFVGIGTWHLESLILALPILVHIAFFQFFAGLVILLRDDDVIIGNVILGLIAITTSLYIVATFLPTVWPDCPFQTPISRPIATTIRSFLRFDASANLSAPTKAAALAWLLQTSADEEDVKVTIRALAGLPTTIEVEKSLHERGVVDILTREVSKHIHHLPSMEKSDNLMACLYAIIRLLQSGSVRGASALEPLFSLLDPSRHRFRWNELGRGSCEVALSIIARLQLLYHVTGKDESVFTIDLPVLRKACRQIHLKEMLNEASLLHRASKEDLLRNLQDEGFEIRTRALDDLKMTSRLELQTDAGIRTLRYREWRRRLESEDENEQVECITEFEKLLGDERFRKEIVLSGDKSLIQAMLSTERETVNLSVLNAMPTLLTHGDLREALIDSATIGKVIVLMMPSDLNFKVRTAAVDAISSLAGHDDVRAKVIESTALSEIIALMKDEERVLRHVARRAISNLSAYDDVRANIFESTALSETITLILRDGDDYLGVNSFDVYSSFVSHDDVRTKILDSTTLSEVAALMRDQNWEVRRAANYAINSLASYDNIRAKIVQSIKPSEIIALMRDEKQEVRRTAADAIRSLAAYDDSRAKIIESTALSEVITLMRGDDADMREGAIKLISSLAIHDDIRAKAIELITFSEVVGLMSDEGRMVRLAARTAIEGLSAYDDIRAKIINSPALSEIIAWMTDGNWVMRRTATEAISRLVGHNDIRAKITGSMAFTKVIALMKDASWEVRQAASDAVWSLVGHADIRSKIVDSITFSEIIGLMKDADPKVCQAVTNAISKLAGDHNARVKIIESTALSEIITLMRGDDAYARQGAIGLISSLAGHDDIRAKIIVSVAFSEIIALIKDKHSLVRQAVTTAIWKLAGHDDSRAKIIESAALSEIITLMKDADISVRQAVVGIVSHLVGHDDIRAKIIESITLSEIIALMKDANWEVRQVATDAILSLAVHNDSRVILIESTALEEIITLIKDGDIDGRPAIVDMFLILVGHDDIRAKIIELITFSEMIGLMKGSDWHECWTMTNVILKLVGDDDIRAKIIEPTALSEIITLMKNGHIEASQAVVNIVSGLLGHGMNLLQSVDTNWTFPDDIRAKIINSTALPDVIALMKDENWAAPKILSILAGHDDSRARVIESTSLIVALMTHNSESVRNATAEILPTLVGHSFNFQDIVQLLHNPSPDVVVSVLKLISALKHHEALRTILMEEYLPKLLELLKHEHMRLGCIDLISALCEYADTEEIIRDSEVILVLISWLKSSDDRMKSSAGDTLSKLGLYENA